MSDPVYLFARPNGGGGQQVVSNIVGMANLRELRELPRSSLPFVMEWATRADVGSFYNDGTKLLVRTA